jgi:hypothetical protein
MNALYNSITYSSNDDGTGIYIILGIIAVIVFLAVLFSVLNEKKNNQVLIASPYIKKIKEINQKYIFQTISRASESTSYRVNSKRAYDYFDATKKKNEFIRDNLSYYQQLIEKIKFNVSALDEYKKEISAIPLTKDEGIAKERKISLKSFNNREVKLGAKLLKHPPTAYYLRIHWEYTSPAGRNHYSNYLDCSFNEIKNIVQNYTITQPRSYDSEPQPRTTYNQPKPQQPQKKYTSDDIENIE